MKNKLIIILSVIGLLIIGSVGMFLFLSKDSDSNSDEKQDENNEVVDNYLSVEDIVDKLDNTTEMQYLESMHNVTTSIEDSKITFNVTGMLNGENIDSIYEINIIDNKLDLTVDKNNYIEASIFMAVIDAIAQVNGYGKDSTNFIMLASEYILSELGITIIETENMSFKYSIDISKKYEVPEDFNYISYNNLEYFGNLDKIKSYETFYMMENNLHLLKVIDESNIIDFSLIELESTTNSSYETVKTIAKILLSDTEYEQFEEEFDISTDYKIGEFNVDVDYELDDGEDYILFENEKVVKVTYNNIEYFDFSNNSSQ
ncbi:MAG: hypothetical protein R3Y21_02980 [Mycoplasmatota bacterium]